MQFKYFKGPIDEMSALLGERAICSICGSFDYCFDLDYATTHLFSEDEKSNKVGCVTCLKNGQFEFWHDTEFGSLDENGLSKVAGDKNPYLPLISPENLTELRRTPQIITWQQELWLIHCDDFMIYKGTWAPKDFNENSKNGNGRDLFMEMTDPDYNQLWDDSLEDGQTKLEEWYPTYYVFGCAHCGKLRGNWDCN